MKTPVSCPTCLTLIHPSGSGLVSCYSCGCLFFNITTNSCKSVISPSISTHSGEKIIVSGTGQFGNQVPEEFSLSQAPFGPPIFYQIDEVAQIDQKVLASEVLGDLLKASLPSSRLATFAPEEMEPTPTLTMSPKTAKPKPMQAGAPDDFQTEPSILDCLVPFLKKEWWIWECACGKGQLVKGLRDRGFRAFGTDLYGPDGSEQGHDFLNWVPTIGDAIVTNPPYSQKEAFLDRALMLGRPFAFLMRDSVFDSKERRKILKALGKDFGMVIPPKRPTFTTPVIGKKGGSWFACYWITGWLDLPGQIVFPDE